MKRKSVESATIRAARVELRRRIKAVAIERDKLRAMISEYEDLERSCDDALDGLEAAVEALSRYA